MWVAEPVCEFNFLRTDFPGQGWIDPRLAGTLPLSLKRGRSRQTICYTSAIAHQLAAQIATPGPAAVFTLAQQIAQDLTTYCQRPNTAPSVAPQLPPLALPLPQAALPELEIYARQDGLISIEVGDRALALWLDTVVRPVAMAAAPSESASTTPKPPAAISWFPMPYAHARCCSLLQTARRQQRIVLTAHPADPADPGLWQLQTPQTVPWLTAAGRLVLAHPVERQWISALFSAAEALPTSASAPPVAPTGVAIARDLALAMLQAHRQIPLLAPSGALALGQARFGLLLATQRLLYRWLKALAIVAPTAL